MIRLPTKKKIVVLAIWFLIGLVMLCTLIPLGERHVACQPVITKGLMLYLLLMLAGQMAYWGYKEIKSWQQREKPLTLGEKLTKIVCAIWCVGGLVLMFFGGLMGNSEWIPLLLTYGLLGLVFGLLFFVSRLI